jgi:hypothetical protein
MIRNGVFEKLEADGGWTFQKVVNDEIRSAAMDRNIENTNKSKDEAYKAT